MPTLSKDQRRDFTKRAHTLKPELHVGKDGLSAAFLVSLREAFNTKELLKVKMLESCPLDRAAMAAKLEKLGDISLVRNIGLTYILYKPLEVNDKADAEGGERKSTKRAPAKKSSAKKSGAKKITGNKAYKSNAKRAPRSWN